MSFDHDRTFSRRSFLKITGTLTAAAGLSAALSACAPKNSNNSSDAGAAAGSGDVKQDGTINAAISYELGTNGYDPMSTTAALTIAANWHTLEGLTEIDPATGEVYAALAKELPSGKGKSVDIALRDGATFHNGDPVTAEDVVFSFERVLDPANQSLYASFIPFIEKVSAKDDTTVTITLSEEVSVLANRLSVVKVVPKKAVESNAKEFDANPVGTGPYKMTDNGGTSKTIKFERFDAYTGPKKAQAKEMVWQIIPEASTRTNALQSKTVQAIDSVPYLSIDQLKSTNTVESVQGFGLLFAMFNNTKGNPFAELKNRQAFLYAIDMNKVIETALSGQATAATSFLHKEHPDYREASTVYTYEPEKAKSLFGETGLKKLRLLCTDHDWVKKCTPLIRESLTGIGIDVEFTEKKSSDVYNKIDGKPGEYDVVIAPGDPSVFGSDPDLLMRWWYSGDTWTDSRMHWKGSEAYTKLQKLLDSALAESDASKQKQTWGECFDLIASEVPLYPLFHRKTPTAWDPSTLNGFKPLSFTGMSFLGVGSTE